MLLKRILTIGTICTVIMLIYLQMGRDVCVFNTMTFTSTQIIEEKITLCANKLFINNKKQFAEQLLTRYKDNSFREFFFSKEKGNADIVEFSVYTNGFMRKMGETPFRIVCKLSREEKIWIITQ